ncbi:hypothetical protein GCM10007886_38130 [Methylobacterium gregans]|nr:hypothetical protein GCM10007886_38130 [Methylobacterium gregans]
MFVPPFDKDWVLRWKRLLWDGAHCPLRRTGLFEEKTWPPLKDSALGIGHRRTQQPQPVGWRAFVARWLLTSCSFEGRAVRRVGAMPVMAGALSSVRDAPAPHSGQAHGSWNCDMGRNLRTRSRRSAWHP